MYALLEDRGNRLLWSAASTWEVAIKHAIGRLPLPQPPAEFLGEHLAHLGVHALPIFDRHAWEAGNLLRHHGDPFDRMLVAQARVEGLTIVSGDPMMRRYDVEVRW